MSIWHRWFNAPPGPPFDFVMDKAGRKFWYRWEDDFSEVVIWHYGRSVGRIYLLWRLPLLELADIVLFRLKHRGRGVGSALMREIIALAKRRGVKRIVGRIVATDGMRAEYLFEWYRRMGFEVDEDRSILSMEMGERRVG